MVVVVHSEKLGDGLIGNLSTSKQVLCASPFNEQKRAKIRGRQLNTILAVLEKTRSPISNGSVALNSPVKKQGKMSDQETDEKSGVELDDLDPVAYASLLKQCTGITEGKLLHSKIIKAGHDHKTLIATQLMQMYRKFGSLEDVQGLFEKMQSRDVFSWNVMLAAYTQHGRLQDARRLFDEMQERNVVSWNTMMAAYAQNGYLQEARRMFDQMPQRDVVSWTTILSAFAKRGHVQEARKIFDNMRVRSVAAWNAMIAGYAQAGHSKEALEIFRMMDVKPDVASFLSILEACASPRALTEGKLIHASVIKNGLEREVMVGNALVHMYGQCGSLEDATLTFDNMPRRNVVTWNAMVVVYCQNGYPKEAVRIIQRMDLEGMQPNEITFISILDVCASLTALAEGRVISQRAVAEGYLAIVKVGNAIVDMYGKCGNLQKASNVFHRMRKRDVVSWTALIVAYAQNGHGKEAFELFRLMGQEGMQPDQVTFLSILSACSYSGRFNDARAYFVLIQDFGVHPRMDHYACMVDLLARAGQLTDAEDLMNNMPFQPDASASRVLLSACRTHRDVERGARAAQHCLDVDPEKSASYVLLADIYREEPR